MKIVNKPLAEITPYANNPRENTAEAVEYVVNSIRRFGIQQPIVLDKDGVIIVGHTRYLAAKEIGLSEFPCVTAENLSEQECREYRIADNSTNQQQWALDKLTAELEAMPEVEFKDFGLDIEAMLLDAQGLIDDDSEEAEDGRAQHDKVTVKILDADKAAVKQAVEAACAKFGDGVEIK